MLTFGSLFAGIGGFDLGFERAGMRCIWQVENNEPCRKILKLRFPHAICFRDICEFYPDETIRPDVLCGGFPCQDISNAGKMAGITGAQSGLWSEYARIIRTLSPQFVVVENVSALRSRGLDTVLRDLAACGYDAEWDCIPAASVGAPFVRDRLFVVAYRPCDGRAARRAGGFIGIAPGLLESARGRESNECPGAARWAVEPGLDRLVYGVSPAMDRLRMVGNCVAPDVAELIGGQIIKIASGVEWNT